MYRHCIGVLLQFVHVCKQSTIAKAFDPSLAYCGFLLTSKIGLIFLVLPSPGGLASCAQLPRQMRHHLLSLTKSDVHLLLYQVHYLVIF